MNNLSNVFQYGFESSYNQNQSRESAQLGVVKSPDLVAYNC